MVGWLCCGVQTGGVKGYVTGMNRIDQRPPSTPNAERAGGNRDRG